MHLTSQGMAAPVTTAICQTITPLPFSGKANISPTSAKPNAALLSAPALPVGELTDEQIVEIGVECDAIPEECWSEAQIEFARAILAAARSQPAPEAK